MKHIFIIKWEVCDLKNEIVRSFVDENAFLSKAKAKKYLLKNGYIFSSVSYDGSFMKYIRHYTYIGNIIKLTINQ